MEQYRIIFKTADGNITVMRANTKEGAYDLIEKTIKENKGTVVVSASTREPNPQAIPVEEQKGR